MDVLSNQGTWTANPCREGPRTMLLSPWQQVVDLLLAAGAGGSHKAWGYDRDIIRGINICIYTYVYTYVYI